MHVHACCIIKFKHHVYHTKTKSVYILWDKKIIIIIIKYLNLSVCTSLYTWSRASMRIHTCIYSARSVFRGLRVRIWKYQKYSVFQTLTAGKLFFCFVRTFTGRCDEKHEIRPPSNSARAHIIIIIIIIIWITIIL